ncbi:pep-cterm sorting domain-containing protein [Anaeramoeba flamelloides]|uniref:Pep-cterm sorting domain-containing protein n=1 Tax=Anaeramoeba flamelloides TaxID=1746091 RepID=A0AAV7ZS11_9EUKA|nr:pep-cterm sorting domain-containing protein [Anaeramoeba flamelloides]
MELKYEYLQGEYQGCPKCEFLNYIPAIVFGFTVCEKCGTIFCSYCCMSFQKNFDAYSHYLTNHYTKSNKKKQGFETQNMKEIAKKIKVIKIKTNNFKKNKYVLMRKEEKTDVLMDKLEKKSNRPFLYCDDYVFGKRYLKEGKTLKRMKMVKDCELKEYRHKRIPTKRGWSYVLINAPQRFYKISETIKTIKQLQEYCGKTHSVDKKDVKIYYQGVFLRPFTTIRKLNASFRYPLFVVFQQEMDEAIKRSHPINQFLNLLKSQEQTDLTISGFKLHSSMLKLRLGLDPVTIQKELEKASLKKKVLKQFLKWVYGQEKKANLAAVTSCLQIFNLTNLDYPTLQQQLTKQWEEDQDKDFTILVQDPENEEQVDEIKAHRIVLHARSELFQNMFNIAKENTNKVKDYSGKSFETIAMIVKYFYTGKLEMTADTDPDTALNELEDAQEYYQINPKSHFNSKLHLLKQKLKNNK